MKTIAVVHSKNLITWRSCKSISANIKSAYELLNPATTQVKSFTFNDSQRLKNIKLADEILSSGPDIISFIDHFPHPGDLIKQILKSALAQGLSKLPELYIYAYGDFTMNFKWWADCEETLSHFNVKFLTASAKQKKLLSQMTTVPSSVHLPYPVDVQHFAFDPSKRAFAREKLGHDNDEYLFLYTGRLSRQKSILELVRAFFQWSEKLHPKATLLLAGEFDDLGVPYLSRNDDFNQYFTEYQALINVLPEQMKNRIRYLGNFSYDELPTLYCAADCYVSFSVHNDEDFGMAPAEAAATGLPLLLTDWAGLSSFAAISENCDLLPVTLQDSKVSFCPTHAGKLLFKKMTQELTENDRASNSQLFHKYLSVESVSDKLNDLIQSPPVRFESFTELFKEIAAGSTELGNKGLFSTPEGNYNQLYRRLYEVYL